jgi:LysM repeat protein
VRPRAPLTALIPAIFLVASPTATAAEHYTVRWGDTLTAIAEAHGTTLTRLARANGLDPSRVLLAGTTIRLPATTAVPVSYTVRRGDNLSAIAARYGTTVSALAQANRLDPGGVLLAGITLRVPPPGVASGGLPGLYTVRPGDTLSGIALRYGTTVARLARANRIDPPGLLLSGLTIRVPSAPLSAAQVAAEASVSTMSESWSVRAAIDQWAAHYGVDAALVRAVAWQESGFQSDVVSPAGAWGVMQITPSTWRYVETVLIGYPIPHTADGNVRIGTALLHHLLHEFGGNERLAVAAYYQGAAAVRRFGVLPVSKPYVANVLALKGRI